MLRLVPAVLAFFLATAPATAGPVSLYYLTNGDAGTNWRVQGGSAVASAQAHPEDLGEYAIAVDGDIRTLGNGNQGGGGPSHPGSQYGLDFTYTGTDYAYPGGSLAFYDGTTDGTYNYALDYLNGGVYQLDRSWANPVELFETSAAMIGITYDPTNNSLWIAQFGGGTIFNYTLGGALLSSWSLAGGDIGAGLGLDHADSTLWTSHDGTFRQYSKAGQLLSTETIGGLGNTLGGEFNLDTAPAPVPEPGTMLLLGAGLAAVAIRRYRNR